MYSGLDELSDDGEAYGSNIQETWLLAPSAGASTRTSAVKTAPLPADSHDEAMTDDVICID